MTRKKDLLRQNVELWRWVNRVQTVHRCPDWALDDEYECSWPGHDKPYHQTVKMPTKARAKRWFRRHVLRKRSLDLSEANKIAKDIYGSGIAEQINQTSPIWSRLDGS